MIKPKLRSKGPAIGYDLLIGIGGGAVGRDELIAAKRLGKEVRFLPADKNHRKAREKARKNGLPEPSNFSGAAAQAFGSRHHQSRH